NAAAGSFLGLENTGHLEIVLVGERGFDKARRDEAHVNVWRELDAQALRQVDDGGLGRRIDLALWQPENGGGGAKQSQLSAFANMRGADGGGIEGAGEIDLKNGLGLFLI